MDDQKIEELYSEALALINLGKWEEAKVILLKILSNKPDHLSSLNEMGRYHLSLEEFSKGEEYFLKIIKLDPDFIWAHYNLAVLYRDQGRNEQAFKKFQDTLKIDPDEIDAINEIGRHYHQIGELEKAKEYFLKSINLDFTYWRGFYNLGLLAKEKNDFTEAKKQFLRVVNLEPLNLNALNELGLCHYEQEEYSAAIPYFEKVITTDESYYWAIYNLGLCYSSLGDMNKAEELWLRTLLIKPDYANALSELGRSHFIKNEYDKAEEYYGRTIAADPLFVWAHSNMGLLHYEKGNVKKARRYLVQAMEIDPSYALPYNTMGLCALQESKYAEAKIYFTKAMERKPNYIQAIYNLGLCHLDEKEYEEARNFFLKTLEIQGDYPYPYYGLGRYYTENGNETKGIEYFRKALEFDPSFTIARDELENLGEIIDEAALRKRAEELENEKQHTFNQNLKTSEESETIINPELSNNSSASLSEEHPEEEESYLNQIGRNLNQLAKNGELNPCIGRQKEMDQILEVLFRRFKNNPIILGHPGVGKTAIVEGIAQRIISGDVPDFLKNKEIIELSTGMLVAGTTYRGQFETKIKRIIDEVTKQGNVILFIDEIHTIMGAGRVEGGNLDFSQMFKPALARGEITCIGATTLQEYRKYIEKDQALERRFYPIKVEEPGLDDTREILAASREKAESYYKITISDEIINSIVQLTDQHLKKRFFPDKAIDVFEKAAARAALRGGKIVSPETIKEIIGEISGINFMENDPSSTHRLLELHAKLKMDIFGQDEAIDKVCNILKITKRRLDLRPEKPDGVFLFSGPSGVGKTWLAKRLTHHLFGDEKRLIRADMSEFSDQTSVNRIIGAPPGYVGYDDETPLTSKIENYPSSILLLDEIEKAHPDVIRLFLQIFDEGRITDSHGRKIYFSNTTIIMTSNVLTHRASPLGFATSTETEPLGEAERKAMDQHFPREFLNRIDEVILFSSLERSHIVKILREKVLQQSKQRFTRENVNLTFSDTLIDHVVNLGYDPEWGARNLERTFERIVLGPLVNQILTNPQGNSLLHLDWQNNNLVITTEQLTDIPDHQ